MIIFNTLFIISLDQGCNSLFQIFFPCFTNFSQKIRIFGSIFSSLKLKTALKDIKTLKRYCKATLTVFFNEKS